MTNFGSCKAAGVENLSGRFLKNGANILVNPTSALSNLPISQGVFFFSFSMVVKLRNYSLFFKKRKKTDPTDYSPIS